MAKETVIIGCKLPSGITLEIGLQTTAKDGNGKLMTAVVRTDAYQRIVLLGWNHHNDSARKLGVQLPAGIDTSPYLNRNVDKAAWDQWKAEHKGSWLLKNEILFEAKDEPSAQLRKLEGDHTPAPFVPLVPKKLPKDIETADFDPLKEKEKA